METGPLDLWVLAGPSLADVVGRFTELTGCMQRIPRWMLGLGQSRWSYTPADRVSEIARAFRAHRFPCDVLYLDIDYMDRYRSFTWNPETFPAPERLIEELHALGFKVMAILNSAVAVDPSFPVYREGHERGYFLQNSDGTEYHASMWPGMSAFPDFTRAEVRAWWGDLHRSLLELGIDGIWNDMNEPTVFGDTRPLTFPADLPHRGDHEERAHAELHNAYGMLMDVATSEGLQRLRPDRRIPLLSRAAYAGVQRHAFLWTGDNSAWWEHMRLAIAQVCNLGLCGVSFSGPDTGGFLDDATPELFLRWLQMGIFLPFLRAHSVKGSRDAEPWEFGEEVLEAGRSSTQLRYALIPYLYNLAERAARWGEPMVRPLFYDYPDDAACEGVDDQFMLGPDLLVAPVLFPGHRHRAVLLPPGEWFDFSDGTLHGGGTVIVAASPLERIPVYVRANAIIPMEEPGQFVDEQKPRSVSWQVWDAEGTGLATLLEDDGQSARHGLSEEACETRVRGTFAQDRVEVVFEPREGGFDPGPRSFQVVLRGRRPAPKGCSVDGVSSSMDGSSLRFADNGLRREVVFFW